MSVWDANVEALVTAGYRAFGAIVATEYGFLFGAGAVSAHLEDRELRVLAIPVLSSEEDDEEARADPSLEGRPV